MMQLVDDIDVTALSRIQPLRNTGYRGGAQAGFLLYDSIGSLVGQHLGGLKTVGEFENLPFSHQVAQKAANLPGGFQGKDCLNEYFVFFVIPVHNDTLA